MKRLISSILAVVITLSMLSSIAFADNMVTFSDIEQNHYCYNAASALAKLKIIEGYADKSYKPQNSITRAEMAVIICRVLKKQDDVDKALRKTDFTDINLDYWANKYINVASKLGIINGDGDGTFRPEDEVMYEEAIKMLICAFELDGDVVVDPADWSAGYLSVAVSKGITVGLRGGKGQYATRGDVAVMLYNALAMDIQPPVASLKAGTYKKTQTVELSTDLEYGAIFYTLDGTSPTTKSDKYNNKPIMIKDSCTLKAVVVKDGVLLGEELVVEYVIDR